MYTDFNKLPNSSRVWIYQSSHPFADSDIPKITHLLIDFLNHWNNHGEGLKSSCLIKYNQFIIIALDEHHKEASGCSIDASVQVIKKIETAFNVDLLDKRNITFKINDTINTVSLQDFQNYVSEEKITPNTIVFNNMVTNLLEFNTKWEVPAKDSWHSRYFK